MAKVNGSERDFTPWGALASRVRKAVWISTPMRRESFGMWM